MMIIPDSKTVKEPHTDVMGRGKCLEGTNKIAVQRKESLVAFTWAAHEPSPHW